MQRALVILYILFCFELGMFLVILPWVSIWSDNHFVLKYGWVAAIALNHYFRGAVSGLGLADIWLAFHEFWRLREALGLAHPRVTRGG